MNNDLISATKNKKICIVFYNFGLPAYNFNLSLYYIFFLYVHVYFNWSSAGCLFILLLTNLFYGVVEDDGRNISSFGRAQFSFTSYGSNSSRFCFFWWFVTNNFFFFLLFVVCCCNFQNLMFTILLFSCLFNMFFVILLSTKALQFTPRLKGVLSRVLPILGNVRDVHRPIFANG